MIPYNALKTFQLVIQLGSLRKAADELNLTESAVSHQLKKLEQALEEQLFYKEGRKLKGTPKGLVLAQQLQVPFADIEHYLSIFKEAVRNDIEVFCIASLITRWLMPKLVAFSQSHPDVSVSLNYLQSMPTFIDEHAICIRSSEPDEVSLSTKHRLFSGETIPVCSPLYLTQRGYIDTAEALLHHELLHDKNTLSWQTWLAQFELSLSDTPHHIFEDFYLLKAATLAAQGIALCPIALIEEEIVNGQLIKLFDQKGNIGRDYILETNKRPNQAIQALSKILLND